MDCGLLRLTRAGASEPGWQVCVVTRVIVSSTCFRDQEPGLSDSESGHASIVICLVWRQSVTWAAASEGGPLRVFLERKLCEICAQYSQDW